MINSKEEKKIREGGQIEVRRLTTSSSELENNNNGPHEVSSKDKPSINLGFIEWFVGISEAESNFICRVRKNKEGVVTGFEFVFRIALHPFLCFFLYSPVTGKIYGALLSHLFP
uniref:LAGLIDADG endonuclease n=1 Tax=Morchella brunnea TaxID=1174671 RepID=A0A8K1I7X8_9PEZI|nr:LAGLIDADG endonuclease [Morchella brunnea]UBU98516.1 LAGLIDADG endonuclease [Morchella brunnea]